MTDDLLKGNFSGHCYVASECYFHLVNEPLKPMNIQHEGVSHWFLKNTENGEIIDITFDQFKTGVPYNQARGRGFLTKKPSKRCQKLIDRILLNWEKDWKSWLGAGVDDALRNDLVLEIRKWFNGEVIQTYCGRSRPYDGKSLENLSNQIFQDFPEAVVLYLGELFHQKILQNENFRVWACDDAQAAIKWIS